VINSLFLWNFPIVITGLATLLLIFSVLVHREKLFLVCISLILAYSSLNPINELSEKWGFGTSWILMILIGMALVLFYRLNVVYVLFRLSDIVDVFLYIILIYLLASPLIAYEPAATLRRAPAYMFVIMIGWRIFGEVFRTQPKAIRSMIHLMIYTYGISQIVWIFLILIIVGPIAFQNQSLGGAVFALGGYTVSRLQYAGLFHGTAVSTTAALGIVLTVHWLKYVKNKRNQLILFWLLLTLVIILFWGGGRTAMFALYFTLISLFSLELVAKKGFSKIKQLIAMLLLSIIPLISWSIFEPIIFRERGGQTIGEMLQFSRFDNALSAFHYFEPYRIWGSGVGALFDFAKKTGTPLVEVFYFNVLIEFGYFLGTLYIIAWLLITIMVVRADMYYLRHGHPRAWISTGIFLIVWFSSITAYGFALPTSILAFYLSIGAAARYDLLRIRKKRLIERNNLVLKANSDKRLVSNS